MKLKKHPIYKKGTGRLGENNGKNTGKVARKNIGGKNGKNFTQKKTLIGKTVRIITIHQIYDKNISQEKKFSLMILSLFSRTKLDSEAKKWRYVLNLEDSLAAGNHI